MNHQTIQTFFDESQECGTILTTFTFLEMTKLKLFGERLSVKFQEQSISSTLQGNKEVGTFFASSVTRVNENLKEIDTALKYVWN
jgi:hypothetical protein